MNEPRVVIVYSWFDNRDEWELSIWAQWVLGYSLGFESGDDVTAKFENREGVPG